MSSIKTLLVRAAIAFIIPAIGQSQEIKPLSKGDSIPDLTVKITKGDSTIFSSLRAYKGKLLLLDFWAVNCVDCIAGLPKMLSLQQKFQREIKIIVVTHNSEKEVQELWKRFESKPISAKWVNAGRQLPFITGDTTLAKIFPHKVLPTHVWIANTNTLIAKTYHTSTSENNVKRILENKTVILDEQTDIDIKPGDPISWLDTSITNSGNIRGYSFLTNHIEFGAGGYILSQSLIDSNSNKPIGISCLNKSILDLYKEAYSDCLSIKPSIPNNRVILEVADKNKFLPPKDPSLYFQWARDNTFCYAMKLPVNISGNVLSLMKSDLDRFFYLKSSIKIKKIKCWVLKRINRIDKIRSPNQTAHFENGNKLIIKNLAIKHLFNSLGNLPEIIDSNVPFVDNTNYRNNINIELPWNENKELISLTILRKNLQQYGLDLTQEYVPIKMLVIEDY